MFTPEDIEGAKLPRAVLGGYRASATRQYLRQVAWELSHVLHERRTFEDEAHRFQAQLRRYERREELESAKLSGARGAAHEICEQARRDAELILKKAHKQASEIRATAEMQASSRAAEIHALEEQGRTMRTELRGLITSALEALGEPTATRDEQASRPVLDDLQKAVRAAATQRVSELNPKPTGGHDRQQADEDTALPADDKDDWSGDERVA